MEKLNAILENKKLQKWALILGVMYYVIMCIIEPNYKEYLQ